MAVTSSDRKKVVLSKPLSVVGGVFVAPQGAFADVKAVPEAAPEGAETLGFITSDAVTRTVDKSVENIYAWGGYLIAVALSEVSTEVSFNCAEYLNAPAQRLLYGTNNVTVVEGTPGTEETPATPDTMSISGKLSELPEHVSVMILVKSETAHGCIIYDDFQCTELEDVQLMESEPTVVPIKGVAFANDNGESFREYWSSTAL